MLQSNQKIIRHKVGLLNLAEELGNVSKACQMMGLSRDTFYRYRAAVELCPKVVFWHLNQAATRSTSVTSTPSLNFTPVITLVK